MNVLARDPGLAVANRWQRGFPIAPRPFAEIGAVHGLSEYEVIFSLRDLIARGLMSRVGAIVRPNAAGASTLAALAVPANRLNEAAALVSEEPFVNHNYEREHDFNLWFVVAAPDARSLELTLERIGQRTDCHILDLRLERPYHIDLGFSLAGSGSKAVENGRAARAATPFERRLLAAMEDGITLISRPFDELGCRLGVSEDDVIVAVHAMLDAGIIQRFGCVLRHRELGYRANAMAVWDIDENHVDAVGARLAASDGVTLCYRRNRVKPHWRYNLFAMIHGREREAVATQIAALNREHGLTDVPHDVLFSRRCFKQRGARFSTAERQCA